MRVAHHGRRSVAVALLATLLVGAGVHAQDPVADAFCALFTPAEVADAVGTEVTAQGVSQNCAWTATNENVFTYLVASWNFGTFEQAKGVLEGGEDLTIGGRPAYYAPTYNMLLIDLDAGTLTMQFTTSESVDVKAALTGLGELAVSRSGSLVPLPTFAPPSAAPVPHADPALEARFPATVGGQPLTIQSMAGSALSTGTDSNQQQIEEALASQGKTLADVTFAFGTTPDFSNSIVALRIAGADAKTLLPVLLAAQAPTEGQTQTPGQVAGKDVLVVEGSSGKQTYYAKDDIIWLVQAEEPLLTEILGALP